MLFPLALLSRHGWVTADLMGSTTDGSSASNLNPGPLDPAGWSSSKCVVINPFNSHIGVKTKLEIANIYRSTKAMFWSPWKSSYQLLQDSFLAPFHIAWKPWKYLGNIAIIAAWKLMAMSIDSQQPCHKKSQVTLLSRNPTISGSTVLPFLETPQASN